MHTSDVQAPTRPARRTTISSRTRSLLRRTLVLALLTLSGISVKAEDYVFMYNGGYLAVDNSGNIINSTSFNPQCVWTCVSNTSNLTATTLGGTSRFLYSTDGNGTRRWLVGSNTDGAAITTSTTAPSTARWQNSDNKLRWNQTNNYYAYYRENTWRTSRRTNGNTYGVNAYRSGNNSGTDYRSFTYTVTSTPHNTPDDNTTATVSIERFSNNTITFRHSDLSGSYTPAYTTYTFNYPENNSDHNYYNNTDYGSTVPSVNANTLSPTYTWSLTSNGGGVASINSTTGVLTLSGAPTSNIVVRLTVSNISPLSDKTEDFTLTRASVAQNVSSNTTLTTPTITPSSATLNYGGNQEFTASATATTTTTTTPAYTTLTGGGNTYYYYDNALHNAAPSGTSTETHPAPTYTWALTGTAATGGYLTPTSGDGSTITINYANASANTTTATLTVTASAQGASNKTATATITANRTLPTAISASPSSVVIQKDATGQFTYTLTPAGAYDDVTVTSDNTSIATVTKSGNTIYVTGVAKGSTTITLSAARPENTALTKTVAVTVKEACAEPTITITPTTAGSTATVTIITATDGATIYYTTDGTDPTTSSTPYDNNNKPEIDNGVTIKAIAVKDDYLDSPVASETYTAQKIATPTISITKSGVTFECATTGVTYYYTTDGSSPTTGSTQWNESAITGLADGTTIKVIAAKQGMISSDPASSVYYPASDVSGGKVIINDYEDHTWTYYSGVDASVDGGNYNTNYEGKMYSPNPRNIKITYRGKNNVSGSNTVVKVSVNESDSVFIYYKTLEQGSTSGEYPYQVISNPFSVRPSTGTNNKVYYGFAGWKIVSGGEYIKNHNNNDVLSLDEEIIFNNLPYPSVNCTSAEIVFETTWTQANVQTGNNIGTMLGQFNGGTYETNFAVLTGSYTTAWTGNKNATITSVYPDGSSDVRSNTNYTRLNVTINSGYTIKYEYININNSSSTFTMGSGTKTLYIGRGVSNTTANGVVCNLIQGFNDNITSGGLTYTLKIESGVYNYLTFAKGYDGSGSGNTVTGTVAMKSVLGCDYDRAKNDNTKLKIQTQIIMGYGTSSSTAMLKSPAAGDEVLNVTFKSGSLHSSLTSAGTADASQSFYIGIGNSYCRGYRVFNMEGGEMWSLAAGLCQNTATTNSVRFRIKGGLIKGSIYGSAANANSYGYKQMILTGGQVKGWIAGGGNGTSANGGVTTGSSYVYVGGNARVDSEGSTTKINSSLGGQVFGSGSGVENTTTWGEMLYGSNVVIADNAYIERNVFGGGNFGWTDQNANIYLTGTNMSVGNVYGGANQNKGDYVNIYMTGGTVREGLYGGSNTTGTINYNVKMQINGGQVGSSAKNANIHGGGYGSPTRVSGNVEITLGASGQTEPGVTVYGDVYGGSALGYVNGTSATNTYHTYVTLNKGTINGSLYGGGLGNGSTAANVYGPVQVKVYGGSINKTDANGANGSGGVYGANNIKGAPQRSVTVDIYGTDPAPSANEYALYAVYGGGNQADYTYGNGYPKVTIHNCDNSIEYVYGGGNAAAVAATDVTIWGGNKIGNVFGGGNGTVTAANVTGNAATKIYGGTIGKVFGGSNSQGTIGGTINVTIQKQSGDTDSDGSSDACDMHIDEVYGGGNMAPSQAGSISIGCTGEKGEGIGDIYGGANQAAITGDITLNITGGSIGRVFGGNNISGSISGGIQVNVNWKTGTDKCGYDSLGSVFGAGNLAQYTIPSGKTLAVNILNGTVSGNVYGGGKGDATDHTKGQVTGNPVVTIGDATKLNDNNVQVVITGDVYGGGDAGNVEGTPQVNIINKCNTTIANVYGGGNAADVSGTDVNIDGGNITGMVFGGGHGDKNANPQTEANVNGNVAVDITGGTINKVFGGSNSKGAISGYVAVNIAKGNNSCEMHITEVYGGGNEAAGNAGTITIKCTGDYENNGEGITTVYGGANAANVGNSINLTIKGGHIDNVYGGNNASGSISGSVTVTVNWDDALECDKYLGNVFGGGNLAALNGAATVNIQKGTVSHNVYGGGNQAGVGSATVSMTGGSVLGGLYGGCNTSGTVGGAISVSLTGGQIGTSSSRADVFGGGLGSATKTSGNIGVTLNGTTVYGDLYGGSAFGSVNTNTNNTDTLTIISSNTLYGTIYGGGKGSNEGDSITATTNGNVLINYNTTNDNLTGLYGGANINGLVVGDIEVNVKGNVGADANRIDIFGGGLGHNTNTNGNVTVNVGTAATANAPIIYGDIYGGSALGNVNDAAADLTTVNILNGTVHGNIYGGGLGDATVLANGYLDTTKTTVEAIVNGTVHVNIGDASNANSTPTIDGKVFGCNNLAGTPKGNVFVDVYRTAHSGSNTYPDPEPDSASAIPTPTAANFAISEVYGGGNLAHYTTDLDDASTHVHIHNCNNTIQYVYGGGNAANSPATEVIIEGGRFEYVFGGGNGAGTGNPGANVEGNSNVILNGGIINYVFGGSNTLGVVNGTASIGFDESNETNCTRLVKELYGGGNQAPGGSVDLTIPCGVSGLNLVFGGSRNADIGVDTLFNKGIKKNITLTIVGGNLAQVFGGNNQGGTIWGDVTLNLKGGTITDAFGGNNAGGNVKGSITVNVTDAESTECPLILTNVFGGGKDAAYTPAYDTISSPIVNINHIKNGTSIRGSVFGGGQGSGAVVTANPVVTIGDENNGHYASITGNVYGGGDAAAVTGNTTVTMQNANSSAANLFGGGNEASVSGTASVTLTAGHVTTGIYGGCNSDGNIGGKVTVNVNGGTVGAANSTANVHGGGLGNKTRTLGSVEVNIGAENAQSGPTIYGDVYGGSAKGKTNGNTSLSTGATTAVTLNAGTINGSLYGGGLGDNNYSADVYGPVAVKVYGGSVYKTDANGANGSGGVYGANNVKGAPLSSVTVDIYGTDDAPSANDYAIFAVYGGGNQAAYTYGNGYPKVTVHNCDNSIGYVYGGGNAAAVAATDVTIYGGNVIGNVFGGGNGTGVAADFVMVTGAATTKIYGGTIRKVFAGNNSNGLISGDVSLTIDKQTEEGHSSCSMKIGEVYGGGNLAVSKAPKTFSIGCTGAKTASHDSANDTDNRIGYELEGINAVYGGANQADVTSGNIALTINSGMIANVFGGNNQSGSISGSITVNIEKTSNSDDCGWYVGNVFGGGNLASYTPTTAGAYPEVNIKNGTISGNVFGGGLGASAKVYSNPKVTIGDVSEGHSSYVATVTGNVYGGGSAAMVGDAATASINYTTVLIQKSNTSVGKVFGGGAQAGVTGTTTVTIADGSVSSGVYGGCDESGTVSGDIAVYVNGGTVGTDATHTANVHGGGLGNSTATGADVTVIIGDSTTTPTVWGDVYGGSGYGNVNASSTDLTKVWLKKGTINGNVYGGGLGQKAAGNNPAYEALVNGAVEVVVDGGTVTGSVFGCNNANGAPQSTVKVDINATDPVSGEGYALSKVFGGGNEADYNGIPQVTIHGCDNTIEYVYGGGNLATVKGTVVTVYGGRIGNVFGGGYGASVTNDGTDVNIYGGAIGYVFGGNNQSGTVTGQISVDVDKQTETGHSPCEMHIGEVYGGGNLAASQAGTVTIGCTGTATEGIEYVYGGAKDAQVTGDINLTITGGRITEAVFGGNNVGHTVKGDITVNIEWDGSCDQNYVKDVFGGGNMAPYYNAGSYPAVNIKNGTVSGSVYGGGKGADAVVTANPVVTIGDITEGHESYVATVSGNVFGGGDAAAVDDNELLSYTSTNNTTVLIQKSNTSVTGKVFGGGNEAGVKGNAQVTLASGNVAGGVYGGCNTTGTIGGTTQVNVTGGTVGTDATHTANVHGGGYGQGTAVSGNVTVNIGSVTGSGTSAVYSGDATIYGDVYGGSAMGTVNTAYNATTHTTYETTTVNLYSGTIDGNVYGGGLGDTITLGSGHSNVAAKVFGNAEVYQYGAILISRTETDPGNASLQIPVSGMIFGCNNVNGTPKGHVKVVVYKTTGITGNDTQTRSTEAKKATSEESDHTYELLAVFGGGNQAEYVPDSDSEFTEVIIDGCDEVSIHTVYGGGNAASTPATKVEVIGTYEIEYVFGGGNGAGSTNPGANVGYHYYDHDGVLGGTEQEDIDRRLQTAGLAYGTGKASTNIYGGRIHKVFGGSNTKGNVRQASVAMLDEVSSCEMILDGFYGGGKSAYMEGNGDIHLGCVSGLTEIYGGAERADVGSDVVLTLTSGHYDKVYGGNNLSGNIHGSITINIEQTGCKPITIGELFGGGNNAAYSVYGYRNDGTIIPGGTQIYNDPVINIRSCQSIDAIYGGGEGENATLYGNPHINVNIVKGWIDGRDDSNNTPADINPDGVIGTIYGGGKKADVNGDTYIFIADQSTVEMQSLKDLKAKINSATSSSTTEHIEMQVTGSGDNEAITYTISGNASPTLTKTIKQTVNGATITGNVYGGGREADITGSSHIKIGPKQDDEEQQSGSNPAPIRSEQPQQPAIQQPVQNSATESQQSRTVNPVRL